MGTLDKLLTGISQTIKMQGRIEALTDKIDDVVDYIKEVEKEVREIDKRLIRIEAFVEIAQKQRLLKND